MENQKDLFPQLHKEEGRVPPHHTFLWIGLLVVVTIIVMGGCFLYLESRSGDDFVACTEEAKQCPDGSFVGRTGPNCEFARCPS